MKAIRTLLFLFCLTAGFSAAHAQKLLKTGNGKISFTSTRNSDVSAVNNEVNVTINEGGAVSFSLPIKGFRFDMADMEDHFNKYLKSDKYPNASFTGRISGIKKIDFTKPALYKVRTEGNLTIHNVTRKIVVNGTLQIDKNTATLKAKFVIDVDDYKIDTGIGSVIIGDKMNVDVIAKCQ